MDVLQHFKRYLETQQKAPSRVTVKNYLADVKKFLSWAQTTLKKDFHVRDITPETLELFTKELTSSGGSAARSKERYFSSLRKFFHFLKLEGYIQADPFALRKAKEAEAMTDPWHMKEFKNFLYVYNASDLTIKNYIIDVKQFLSWLEQVTKQEGHWEVKKQETFSLITSSMLAEYKSRLLYQAKLSPVSINRKLSSLRRYIAWTQSAGHIKPQTNLVVTSTLLNQMPKSVVEAGIGVATAQASQMDLPTLQTTEAVAEITEMPAYSSFGPLRFFQKLANGGFFLLDHSVVNPLATGTEHAQYGLWAATGKKLFHAAPKAISFAFLDRLFSTGNTTVLESLLHPMVGNVSKSMYAPLAISIAHLPWHKKALHHARYTRPAWYHQYHSYAFAHYLHLAILVIFMSAIGYGWYDAFVTTPQSRDRAFAALPTAPPRILSFQGRLTDASDNPITTAATPLRFAIYNHLTSSGSALLWQETQSVSPDADGVFSVLLGSSTAIPSTVFTDNASLYLGVTVQRDAELTPRQQIASVAYATNSETLQGLLPITGAGAGTNNVVLALDSSGNLSIGGSANPTFQASGGQFKLSGQPLLLTTNSGSNGNIILSPDGTGVIDLQKPLQNTTNNNNIASAQGAVEVDDLFAILATSSGQSAVTINQNSTGPLISASTSGVAKFTVDNAGAGTFADDLAINGGDLTTSATTFNLLNASATTINFGGGATSMSIGATTGTTTINNGVTLGNATSDDITFTGYVASHILPKTDITYDLGSATQRWNNIYANNVIAASSGTSGYWQRNAQALSPTNITDDLLLGGTATSSATFQVFGTTGNATTSGTLTFNTTGSIQTTNNQTLTIGGNTTGNITLSPLNGSGTLTANATTVNLTGTTTLNGTSLTAINGGATAINFNEFDVSASNGSITIDDDGNAGSITIEGSIFDINSLDFVGVGTISSGGTADITLDSAGDIILDAAGSDIIFNEAGTTFATFSDATTDLTLDVVGGNFFFANGDVLNIGGLTGALGYNTMANSGDAPEEIAISSDNDLYIGGDLEVDGTIYGTFVGAISPSGFTQGSVVFAGSGGTLTEDNASFFFDDTNNKLGIGTTVPDGKLHLTGAATGKALAIFNETGDQNIFTASASGTTVLTLDRSGNLSIEGALSDLSGTVLNINDDLKVTGNDIIDSGDVTRITLGATTTLTNTTTTLSGTTTLNGTSLTAINGGATAIDFTEFDVAAGTGSITINDGGDLGSITIEGSIFDLDSLDFVGAGTITTGGTTDLTLNPTDEVILGDTDTLIVGGHAGNIAYNVFANAGETPEEAAISSDNDLYIGGDLEVDGTIYGTFVGSITPGGFTQGSVVFAGSGGTLTEDNASFFFDNTNNYLGLGTTTPTAQLDMTGTASSAGQLTFRGTTDPKINILNDENFGIRTSPGGDAGLTERLTILNNGNVGVGTTAPIGLLNVSGKVTGKALTIFNETGDQDIFTASASGATKFTVGNTGTLTSAAYTNAGGVLYTSTTGLIGQTGVGTASQCLIGGTTPTWSSCSAAASNYWQLNAGVLAPLEITNDLAIGGLATASAKFQVFGLTGNATTSGTLTFNTTGSVQTTNNQTLTIGGSTTGNITLSPLNGSGTLTANATTVNLTGTTTLNGTSLTAINGGATAIDFTEFDVAAGTGSITINDGGDLGNITIEGTILDINDLTFVGAGSIFTTGIATIDATTDIILDAAGSDIIFNEAGTTFATFSDATTDLTLNVVGGQLYLADGDVFNIGGLTGVTYNALSDSTGTSHGLASDNDLFIEGDLEVDGTLYVDGNLVGTGPIQGWWQRNSGVLSPYNITDDLALGGTATSSAVWQVFGAGANAGTASSSGTLTFRGTADPKIDILNGENFGIRTSPGGDAGLTERFTVLNNGNVGVGTTAPEVKLHVKESGTNLAGIIVDTGGGGSGAGISVRDNGSVGRSINIGHDGNTLYLSGQNAGVNGFKISGASNILQLTTDSASNQISFSPGNIELVRMIGSTVGIGTSSPISLLDIEGKTTGQALVQINETGDQDIFTASASGTTRFTITNGGDVYVNDGLSLFENAVSDGTVEATKFCTGDGETNCVSDFSVLSAGASIWQLNSAVISPSVITNDLAIGGISTASAKFQIFGTTGLASSSSTLTFRGTTDPKIDILNGEHFGIRTSAGGDAGLTERFTILNDGNIGIGTTAPVAKLHVVNPVVDTGQGRFAYDSTYYLDVGYNSVLATFPAGGTTNLRIGLTSTPAGSGHNLAFFTRNSEKMRLSSLGGLSLGAGYVATDPGAGAMIMSGNLGIGTTTPLAKLDIEGSASSSGTLTFRGTTDPKVNILNGEHFGIQTSAGGDAGLTERVTVLNNGNVGIGITAPLGKLNVEGAATGKALAIFNETGNQDIFTASASGTTRFTIANNGNLTAPTYNNAGGVLYTSTTGLIGQTGVGTASQCLIGGTTPTWSLCSAAASNYWQLNSGALSPLDISNDLLVGGTATSSAVWQVFAAGTNAGTASSSGQITFRGTTDPKVNILNGENFGIRTSPGGDAGLTEQFTVLNNGNVGIGTTTPSQLLQAGTTLYVSNSNTRVGIGISAPGTPLDVSGIIRSSSSYSLPTGTALGQSGGYLQLGSGYTGSYTPAGLTLGAGTGGANTSGSMFQSTTSSTTANNAAGYFTQTGATSGTDYGVYVTNTGAATTNIGGYFTASGGTNNYAAIFENGNVGIGITAPVGKLNIEGAATGKALAIFNETGDQNILTASASGVTQFTLSRTGNVTAVGAYNGGGLSGVAYNALANSGEAPEEAAISSDNDLYIGGDLEVDGTIYGTFVGAISPAGFTQGSVVFAGSGGTLTEDNANFFWDDTNNKLGIGTTAPDAKLHLTGAATGKALAIFNETGDQNIFTASASGTTVATLDRSGNLAIEGALSDLGGTVLNINDDLKVTGNDIIDSGDVTRITLGATTTLTNTTTTLSGTTTLNGTSLTAINGGATAIDFTEFDVAAATGSITINDGGNAGNITVEGSVFDINSLDFVGAGTITSASTLTLTPTTTLNLNSTGDMTLDSSTDIILDADGADIIFKDAGTTFATFTNSGGSLILRNTATNITIDTATSGDVTIGPDVALGTGDDLFLQDGTMTAAVPLTIADTALNANLTQGIIDAINDVYDLSTGATGASGFWQLNNKVISPANSTHDLAIGDTATSSAVWQVFAVGTNAGTASSSGQLTFRGTTDPKINVLNGENFGIRTSPGGDAGLSERFTVLNNGNVGIGTTTPGFKVDVSGTATSTTPLTHFFGANSTSNANLLRLFNSGTAAIGSSARLSFSNNTTTTGETETAYIDSIMTNIGTSTYTADLRFLTANTTTPSEKMRIQSDGNIGMGTTTPNGELEIVSASNTDPDLILRRVDNAIATNEGLGTLQFWGTDTTDSTSIAAASIIASSSGTWTGTTAPAYLAFSTRDASDLTGNPDERMRITHDGNVGIGTTAPTSFILQTAGSIGPNADITYDLGSTSLRWNNIYANNVISASTGTAGYWQRNAQALSPTNITDDVLVGGTATSSALIKLGGTTNATTYFNTGGNVGIGATDPDALLTLAAVNVTTNQLRLRSSRAAIVTGNVIGGMEFMSNDTNLTAPGVVSAAIVASASANHSTTALNTDLLFFTTINLNYGERMRINASGNVGIGITAPTARLHVVASQAADVATATGTGPGSVMTVLGGIGGTTTIATTGFGGAGGAFNFTGGTGGVANAAATLSTGGAGGALNYTGGVGGLAAIDGTGANTGGAGGAFVWAGGVGGDATGNTSGTNTGGAGGAVSLVGGNGGTATTGSGNLVGGTGGTLTFSGGTGGIGATSGGNGGAVVLRGGTAAAMAGAAGGAASLTGQVGSSTGTGGAGGAVAIAAGAAGGDQTVNRQGGAISLTAGLSKGAVAGGALSLTAGAAGANQATGTAAGSNGGAVNLVLGAGGTAPLADVLSTGGNGGNLTFTSGAGGAAAVDGTGANTGGVGSAISWQTGTGGAATGNTSGTNTGGAGGTLTLSAGTGGAANTGTGNLVGGTGGTVVISAGTGGIGATSGGNGGAITLRGGTAAAMAGAAGGAASLIGRDGSVTGTGGAGGAVAITGGAAGGDDSTNRAGGLIAITAGRARGPSQAGAAINMNAGLGGTNYATGTTTGPNGGAMTFTMGAGGTAPFADVLSTGGNGGTFTLTGGAGGIATSSGAANNAGGIGSTFTWSGGTGGAATGDTTGTNTGGAGGPITLRAGAGGAASNANGAPGVITGGAGGALALAGGTGGAGTGGTAGSGGAINFQTATTTSLATRMTVTSAGNVGIGTTAPVQLFDVSSATGAIMNLSRADTGLAAADSIGKINFWNNDSQLTTQNVFASIEVQAQQTVTTDAAPGNLLFLTTGTTVAGSPIERMRIMHDGNVGIGTTAPTGLLHVNGAATGKALAIFNETGNQDILVGSAAGVTKFRLTRTGDLQISQLIDIDNTSYFLDPASSGNSLIVNGNVGIGTTTTRAMLDVVGDASASGSLVLRGTSPSTIDILNGNRLDFQTSPGGDAGLGAKITLLGNGNVGIGTTAPVQALHVIGPGGFGDNTPTAAITQFETTNTGNSAATTTWKTGSGSTFDIMLFAAGASPANAVIMTQRNNAPMQFKTTDTARLHIEGGGNIGIGTTAPVGKLNVDGKVTGKALALFNETGNQAIFTASASGTTRFVIANDGNVGIGATTPTNKLHIVSNSLSTVKLAAADGTGTMGLKLGYSSTSGYGSITVTDDVASSQPLSLQPQGGNVGIQDSSPTEAMLVVGASGAGDIFATFATANSERLCWDAAGASLITDCTGTPGDYAEQYGSDGSLAAGDVVMIDPTKQVQHVTNDGRSGTKAWVKKTTGAYTSSMIGIISTDPNEVIGQNFDASDNPVPVALNGRVPVKVSLENGPIAAGDPLTSSSISGVAMKATKAGPIIGKAEEAYTDTTNPVGKIVAFVNISWYDPEVYMTSTGDFNIVEELNGLGEIKYAVKDTDGNTISRIGRFSEAIIGSITAGLVTAKQITTNSLTITADNVTIAGTSLKDYIIAVVEDANLNMGSNYVSPIASIDHLHTDLISPIGDEAAVAIALTNDAIEIKSGSTSGSQTVARIDNQGNASFSGQLTAANLQTNDASVAGTLRAKKIIADEIEGLDARLNSLAANTITASNAAITNITNVYQTASPSAEYLASLASPSASMIASLTSSSINTNYANIGSLSAILGYIPEFKSDFVTVTQGLMSYGSTSLSDTAIAGQLSINGSMILADNSIDTLGSSLEIQSLRQGNVSFMAGLVNIDTDGNLTVSGNANFAKDVTVNGNLATSTISPLTDQNLNVNLASSSALSSELRVNNASGSGIFAINQLGDFIASGAASIGKLNFNLVSPAIALSDTESIATGSAGTAILKANKAEITINNPAVTEKSLIYITPVGNTNNQVLYLLRQTAGTSFTVGIGTLVNQNIPFNWMIVN